jgi:multicomponent Na+:H+ antiporter subunit D
MRPRGLAAHRGQAQMSWNINALPVSIGGISAEFGTASTTVVTAIVAFSIGVAGFTMLGARVGQRFGPLRMFRWMTAAFLAAMVVMTFSASPAVMIAAQALAGLAPAAIVPSLVALPAHHYKGQQQATALGVLGAVQAISHATAKAGMFMAAGLVYAALGHDRIADLGGVACRMPVAVLAFAVSGVALMGVVPSGAYLAKKLLLDSADTSGQWWWTMVLQGGAAFTAGYVVLVLANALRRPAAPVKLAKQVSRLSEYAALTLALCSLLLAFAALGPVPGNLISNPLAPK